MWTTAKAIVGRAMELGSLARFVEDVAFAKDVPAPPPLERARVSELRL